MEIWRHQSECVRQTISLRQIERASFTKCWEKEELVMLILSKIHEEALGDVRTYADFIDEYEAKKTLTKDEKTRLKIWFKPNLLNARKKLQAVERIINTCLEANKEYKGWKHSRHCYDPDDDVWVQI